MDSPYGPGAGVTPPLLAGRETERARARDLLARTQSFGSPGRSPLILTGVRGVGKTVTLAAIREDARRDRFVVAHVMVDRRGRLASRIAGVVAERLAESVRVASSGRWRRLRQQLAHLQVEVSVAGLVKVTRPPSDAAAAPDPSESDALAAALQGAGELTVASGLPGLCLTLDEVQDGTTDDLGVLVSAAQALVTSPVVVVCAGLPTAPDRLVAAGSFAERFQFLSMGPLDPIAARSAVLVPATKVGVSWDEDAADTVLAAAAGAPFLLQMFGDAAWKAADPKPRGTIRLEHATAGIGAAMTELRGGMFHTRWARATPLERDYMAAMVACLDTVGTASVAEVAARLGRERDSLNYLRGRLIDKGLVAGAGYGRVAFTMPGFETCVIEQTS